MKSVAMTYDGKGKDVTCEEVPLIGLQFYSLGWLFPGTGS